MHRSMILLALVATLLTGCGPFRAPANVQATAILVPRATATTPIAAATGGQLALPDGGTITFPAGALDRDATIVAGNGGTATALGMPADIAALAPLIDVSLGGAALVAPATVTLRFDRSRIDPATAVVYMAHRDDATGLWTNLAATIDYAAGTATAVVPHFSTLGIFSTTAAKLAGATAEIYEKLQKLQGGAPEPRCGPPGDTWHLTVASPQLVAGCIEALPDGTALLRLYNQERYPQEVDLAPLLAGGLTERLAYPKEQAGNAGGGVNDDLFRKLGAAIPAQTFLPAYGQLTFILRPGDPEHLAFTTQPSPLALTIDVIYQIYATRGLLVGSERTRLVTAIVDTAKCVSETASGLNDRSFKRVILALPPCLDKVADKLFGKGDKAARSEELNKLLDVTKQGLEDARVLRAATELTIDGLHYGPNAQRVALDRAVAAAASPSPRPPTATATTTLPQRPAMPTDVPRSLGPTTTPNGAATATATAAGISPPSRSVATLPHTDAVYAVAWSPDGRTLASGALDNTVRLWR